MLFTVSWMRLTCFSSDLNTWLDGVSFLGKKTIFNVVIEIMEVMEGCFVDGIK